MSKEKKTEVEPPKVKHADPRKIKPMFKVTIHSGERDEDKNPVFVGINGYTYLIQRDEEVVLSDPFVKNLQTQIETFKLVKDKETGETKRVPIKIPRYSMTIEKISE